MRLHRDSQIIVSCFIIKNVAFLCSIDSQEAGNIESIVTTDKSHNATARYTAITDLNLDGRVDEADILMIASVFSSEKGEKDYDQMMAFDDNGIINIIDITKVATEFGKMN